MTNNNELLELKELGLKRYRKNHYIFLSPDNHFVTVRRDIDFYSIEVDGKQLSSRKLSLESIKQIIKILY